jgi:multicomponent Na+:H+ antiporter subunit A
MQNIPPLVSSLALLTLTGLILRLVAPHRFRHAGWLAAIPPAMVTAWQIAQINQVAAGQFLAETYAWAPQLGLSLSLRLDGLALFFGLIITGIGTAIALYTAYYLEDDRRQGFFYCLLFLFMASMLGLVWSDNLLTLFVFWEGTSITSYLLIAYKSEYQDAVYGGRRALLVTGLGGLAMLFGLVLLGSEAGSYSISEIIATPGLEESALYPAALFLLLIGAFTKSAQFPFHFWLPGAMAAPTPASAYLHSATMVKAGVFLLARLHPALSDSPLWFWSLFLAGGITMLLGATSALRYHDIKGLLAYATVSQLGILVMLLAFRSEYAYTAVVISILAHALYKGPLFLIAGIVDHATGTRDLRRFGGLGRQMPLVAGAAVLAGVSMAGLPPLFGFVAKELLLETVYQVAYDPVTATVGWIGFIATAITGAFFVGYSFTLLWELFFRPHPTQGEHAHIHHAPDFWFVLPPLALTLLGTSIPFFMATIEGPFFDPVASAIAGFPIQMHLALWHGWNLVLITSLLAIGAGTLIFLGRDGVRAAFARVPANINGAYLFDKIIYANYDLANWTTRTVQGGTLSSQVSVMISAGVIVLVTALVFSNRLQDLAVNWTNTPRIPELTLAATAIIAALIAVRVRTRLNAIISVGVVGIIATLFFVFFDAPDLALTQLLIDILTIVLLILVFYRMPPQELPPISRPLRIRNTAVAVAAGFFGFFLVLFAVGDPFYPTISDYFSLNAVALGHGANVVNVILVDFRALDTLGEITVLAIAAVGGYALLRSVLLRESPPATRPVAQTTAGEQVADAPASTESEATERAAEREATDRTAAAPKRLDVKKEGSEQDA